MADGIVSPDPSPEPAQVVISDECWWDILHLGHHAWYQRRLMPQDFRPDAPAPSAGSVVGADGRCADPASTPACETCGQVPAVADLEPMERLTEQTGFLDVYRKGLRPWPKSIDMASACWYCNAPVPLDDTGLCASCATYLSEEAATSVLAASAEVVEEKLVAAATAIPAPQPEPVTTTEPLQGAETTSPAPPVGE